MKILVLFVHGLGGDAKESWGKFPELIEKDEELKNKFEFDYYGFPTSIIQLIPGFSNKQGIQDIALGLKTFIDYNHSDADEIILVGHSLGGLVIRQYLLRLKISQTPINVTKLLLYAVPNEGSNWSNLSNVVSWKQQQLKQLCKSSDFLDVLNDDWVSSNVDNDIDITCILAGKDNIVSKASVKSICRLYTLESNPEKGHRGIIKPDDENDISYKIFKTVLLKNKELP